MNGFIEKITIRQSLLLTFSILFILVVFTIIFFFPTRMANQARDALTNKATIIAKMTAFTCEAALDFQDPQGVADAIENAKQDADVKNAFVLVFDNKGQIYTGYKSELLEELAIKPEDLHNLREPKDEKIKDYLYVYLPIIRENEKLGGVLIGLSLEEVNTQIQRNLLWTLSFCILIMAAGVFVTFWISGYITKRLDHVVDVVVEVAKGDMTKKIGNLGKDELGNFAISFNIMIANTKEVITRVQDAVKKLDDSMTDIQDGVQNQASTSSQQSASISETTATMEELAQTSRQIAQNSDSVVDVAKKTENAAQAGVKAANDTLQKMQEVSSKNQENIGEIVDLGKKSERIHEIMEIINTITDQTKLIAFNAAIEASAAGESGRRFGIVAIEIRRLADDVEKSTSEIKNKINEIQQAINKLVIASEEETRRLSEGVRFTQVTYSNLQEILKGARETTVSAKEISLATQQQRTASEQIVTALKEINEGTKHFVVTANQTSIITAELTNLSDELKKLINRFKVN